MAQDTHDSFCLLLQVYLCLCHRINKIRQIFAHNLKAKQAATLHFTCFFFIRDFWQDEHYDAVFKGKGRKHGVNLPKKNATYQRAEQP